MKNKIIGGCLCGAIRYHAKLNPKWISYCHCKMCQKAYGQVSGIFLGFTKDVLIITKGNPKKYKSSAWAERSFCDTCGSPVGVSYTDLDSVLIGTLDNPDYLPQNGCHLGIESKIQWDLIKDTLPQWRTEDDPDFIEAIKASKADKQ